MRTKYEWGYSFNEHNIIAGKDDAKFITGEGQWDPVVRQRRIAEKKPTLTFNRLVAFLAQVIGDRLMNETEIRVLPDKGSEKEIANIREGLIRNIFKNSNAEFARQEAAKYQVIGGQGAFYLSVNYCSDDVFEQELRINAVYDPYAAVFDPLGIEPSGKDCQWAFVGEDIPAEEYRARWPNASETSFMDANHWNQSGFWLQEDTVRIVNYWRMVTSGFKTLALYRDGTVHDITDMEEYEYSPFIASYPDGEPYIREVPKRFCQLYICSGNEILEGPYNYNCSSIPLYRVPGWEVNDGERVYRWGLIRHLKDPQRLHNYWRSTVAEQLVAAPRNKWLVTPDAIKGHEAKWRRSPVSSDPFLYYNDGETTPVHVPPPGIDAALVNEAGASTQDLKDISNLHEAALGMPSNEVSGVAITKRNSVSDVGTYIYTDRARMADERCAYNINELIPDYYDTMRTETVMGADNKLSTVVLNDPSNPMSNVTIGRYNVTVTVGPASQTRRTLAAEQMMSFVNAAPQIAGSVMDLIAEAQDWPQSIEFARRFKMLLPQGMVPEDEMTPEMVAMQQAKQQEQQQQQQIQLLQLQVEIANKNAKTSEANSRAHLSMAQAYKAVLDAHSRQDDVAAKRTNAALRTAMETLDQHNDLEQQDREFSLSALSAITQAHSNLTQAEAANAQANAAAAGDGNPTGGENGE
uniref:Portal protein n=1 Tax=Mycena chlorophos TaxID=658473 RepID=A0ABQ0KUK3_MYCCL|nr:predicted protein [Mycena chlorophos]